MQEYSSIFRKVKVDEVVKLEGDSATEFHLVRHYSKLPSEYIKTLIGKDYRYFDQVEKKYKKARITEEEIRAALAMKGSKFINGISGMETPKSLIELIRREARNKATNSELDWYSVSSELKTHFSIIFPYDIGLSAVVNLADLSKEQQSSLVQEKRGELENDDTIIKLVKGLPGTITREITVVIGWPEEEEKPIILTAYPGSYAPALPNSRQDENEKEYSKKYWQEHAFVS